MNSSDLHPSVERLLEDSRPRASRALSGREAATEGALVAGLAIACGALAVLAAPPRPWSVAVAGLLVLAYAVSTRVRFDLGSGYVTPGELVFVPMLFLLPPTLVPVAVVLGCVLGRAPDILAGRTHADRLLLSAGDAFHAVGPAVVLAAAGAGAPSWDQWPIYVAALAAQIALDAVIYTVRDLLALGIAPRLQAALLSSAYLFDIALAPLGLLAAFATDELPAAFLLTMPAMGLLTVFARERRARIDHALELSRAYRGTALLLGDVVDADDAYTGQHSRGVVDYAVAVADALGLDDRLRRNVEFGALLHDVGKIRIPKEILNKPAPLNTAEWALMQQHTIIGQDMLEGVGGVLYDVGRVVRCSHEHFDGGGYPDGLAGEAIPIEARIVACCDAFSAMTTDRPYRRAMTLEAALDELRSQAGRQFDPVVVDVLLQAIERLGSTAMPSPAPRVAVVPRLAG